MKRSDKERSRGRSSDPVEPPLFKAVVSRDRGQIAKLLAGGADVNEHFPAIHGSTFPAGATPLMMAAEGGNLKVVRDLLEAGADVNAKIAADAERNVIGSLWKAILDHGGAPPKRSVAQAEWTALMLAAHAGHAEIVSALLAAGADPRYQTSRGETALSRAREQGHTEIAEVLQTAGAEEIPPSPRLIVALRSRGAAKALEALADGADPETVDTDPERGRVPVLVLSAEAGLLEVVEALLAAGARADAAVVFDRLPTERTALMAAAAGGHTEVVRRLLRAGANVEAQDQGFVEELTKDPEGYRPGSACRSTSLMLAVGRGQAEAAWALIQGGADVNARTSGPLPTALMRAVANGHHETIKMLLAAGADVNAGTRDATPLFLAVANHDYLAMDLLLAAGADPNLKPKDEASPFWITVITQDLEAARRLIDAGANIEKRGPDRMTAREYLAEPSLHDPKAAAAMLDFLNTYSPT